MAGAAFTHVLEIPGKRRLLPQAAVIVQQRLYPGYRTAGKVIESGQLLLLAAAAAAASGGTSFWLTIAALTVTAATMVVFVTWTDRANRVMARWRPDSPPDGAGWRTRRSWETSHAARALLFITAIVLVFAAALAR